MTAGSGNGRAVVPARSRRAHCALVPAILIMLTIAACGGGPPEAPANQHYGYTGANVVLAWDDSPDAEYYAVYYADSAETGCRLDSGRPSGCVELATDLPWTSFTHTPPSGRGAGPHYYWVVACNGNGCSEIDSANPAWSLPPRAGERPRDAGGDVNAGRVGSRAGGDPLSGVLDLRQDGVLRGVG